MHVLYIKLKKHSIKAIEEHFMSYMLGFEQRMEKKVYKPVKVKE